MKIDVVYTWVNGRDPLWKEKKEQFLQKKEKEYSSAATCDARFEDNHELKYSLRSIYKFAPWVNKIFIVTDNQIPEWFAIDNNWAVIVDHKDIFKDHSVLPTYNSSAIGTMIHNINGLSEHFLYFNDDIFLGRECKPSDFFHNNLPYIFVSKKIELKPAFLYKWRARKESKKNEYQSGVELCRRLIYNVFNKYVKYKFRHGVKVINKSDLIEVANLFKNELTETSKSRFRRNSDVIFHALYNFFCLANNKGIPKYAPSISSVNCFSCKLRKMNKRPTYSYINLKQDDLKKQFEILKKHEHLMFCLNQYEGTPPEALHLTRQFLNDYFNWKSPAEK